MLYNVVIKFYSLYIRFVVVKVRLYQVIIGIKVVLSRRPYFDYQLIGFQIRSSQSKLYTYPDGQGSKQFAYKS